ncbi:MAG: hypothetical protein ACJ72O_15800 [Marmoricola sp.]
MRFIRAFVAVAAVTSMLLLLPSPAGADNLQRYDKWKDVLQVDTTEEPGPHFYEPAPDRVLGDITETRVDYRSTVVHVALYVRALEKTGDENRFEVVFKTPKLNRTAEITATPAHWDGRLRFYSDDGSHLYTCRGLTYKVDYDHNRLVLDVPRTCLGSPHYLRVGAATNFEVSSTHTLYSDDAFTSQPDYYRPTLGPAVHSGPPPPGAGSA